VIPLLGPMIIIYGGVLLLNICLSYNIDFVDMVSQSFNEKFEITPVISFQIFIHSQPHLLFDIKNKVIKIDNNLWRSAVIKYLPII
jgi:hypothetical protein